MVRERSYREPGVESDPQDVDENGRALGNKKVSVIIVVHETMGHSKRH